MALHNEQGIPLNWHPDHDEPLRLLPRDGEPTCVIEWISQTLIRALAWAPLYTAVVVTLILLVVVVTR